MNISYLIIGLSYNKSTFSSDFVLFVVIVIIAVALLLHSHTVFEYLLLSTRK